MSGGTRTWHVPGIEHWPQRGGVACLDFANTVAFRPTPQPHDGLRSYDDLLAWSRLSGLLPPGTIDRLSATALEDEPGALAALASARALRNDIFELFQVISAGQAADPALLAAIGAHRVAGMKNSVLTMQDNGFDFAVAPDVFALTRPLWHIAESTTRLLLSADWRRVHLCPGDDCGWLFLDQTRNGNRRWCDSAGCGNRARGRAYMQRQRQQLDLM
jgi:predicted RNA-binding Zn ribbon-like protein